MVAEKAKAGVAKGVPTGSDLGPAECVEGALNLWDRQFSGLPPLIGHKTSPPNVQREMSGRRHLLVPRGPGRFTSQRREDFESSPRAGRRQLARTRFEPPITALARKSSKILFD